MTINSHFTVTFSVVVIVAQQFGGGGRGGKEVLILWNMFYFLACAAKQNVEVDPVIRPCTCPAITTYEEGL